jgi:hypothetical protein
VRPVIGLVAVALLAAGCGGADDGGHPGPATPTTSEAADEAGGDDAVLADVRELLESTPQSIAEDVGALGLRPVTADEVAGVATMLCKSAFDPDVTTSWLEGLIVTNVAMVGPANRLLRYAGTPEACERGPTAYERDLYRAEVYLALAPTPPLPPGATDVPGGVETIVCDLLGEPGAGDSVAEALDRLLDLGSRGGLDAAEFLPFVVEAAGAGCARWLPTAVGVLDRYFNPATSPTAAGQG